MTIRSSRTHEAVWLSFPEGLCNGCGPCLEVCRESGLCQVYGGMTDDMLSLSKNRQGSHGSGRLFPDTSRRSQL